VKRALDARPPYWTLQERIGLRFSGVLVLGWGAVTVLQGKLHDQNYWHAPVLAPFVLLAGVLIIVVASKGRGF
jgi:hypothetical protein